MDKEAFMKKVPSIVQKYCKQYGVGVPSAILSQIYKESAYGQSELAKNAHNYTGLKYKQNICDNYYTKVGSEQNADGTYTSKVMRWCKFDTLDQGIEGYFKFIQAKRYANLKGITDCRAYLETIKADGYCTSLKYVQECVDLVEKLGLKKYDMGVDKMIITVHAGHCADGNRFCGAVGYIRESTQARKVANKVILKLQELGHEVYDCTVDEAESQTDNLAQITNKMNQVNADLNVSIHFNAGGGQGTEVLVYNMGSKSVHYAENTVKAISELGFVNRGVKERSGLYVLKNSKKPTMLVECCFCDSQSDTELYNAENMANAIVKGITGKDVAKQTDNSKPTSNMTLYRVQCGAFYGKENAEALKQQLEKAGFKAIIVKTEL